VGGGVMNLGQSTEFSQSGRKTNVHVPPVSSHLLRLTRGQLRASHYEALERRSECHDSLLCSRESITNRPHYPRGDGLAGRLPRRPFQTTIRRNRASCPRVVSSQLNCSAWRRVSSLPGGFSRRSRTAALRASAVRGSNRTPAAREATISGGRQT